MAKKRLTSYLRGRVWGKQLRKAQSATISEADSFSRGFKSGYSGQPPGRPRPIRSPRPEPVKKPARSKVNFGSGSAGRFAWRHKGKILATGGVGTLTAVAFHSGFSTHSRIANYDPMVERRRRMFIKQQKKMNKKINQGINRILTEQGGGY